MSDCRVSGTSAKSAAEGGRTAAATGSEMTEGFCGLRSCSVMDGSEETAVDVVKLEASGRLRPSFCLSCSRSSAICFRKTDPASVAMAGSCSDARGATTNGELRPDLELWTTPSVALGRDDVFPLPFFFSA